MVGVVLLTAFLAAAFAGIRSLDAAKRPPAVAALVARDGLAGARLARLALGAAGARRSRHRLPRSRRRPGRSAPRGGRTSRRGGPAVRSPSRRWRARRRPRWRSRRWPRARSSGPCRASTTIPPRPCAGSSARDGLNPLSDRPTSSPARSRARPAIVRAARRAFQPRARAATRSDWYPRGQLGVLDLEAGRRGPALAASRRARRMNPREPAIAAPRTPRSAVSRLPAEVKERLSDRVVPAPLGPAAARPAGRSSGSASLRPGPARDARAR